MSQLFNNVTKQLKIWNASDYSIEQAKRGIFFLREKQETLFAEFKSSHSMNKKRIFGIWYRINETALYFYITVSIISFSVLHLQSDPTYSISPADHFSIIEARSSVKWGLLSGSKYDKCCVRNSRHYANKLKKAQITSRQFWHDDNQIIWLVLTSFGKIWEFGFPSARSRYVSYRNIFLCSSFYQSGCPERSFRSNRTHSHYK